jgi:hypothetical protein
MATLLQNDAELDRLYKEIGRIQTQRATINARLAAIRNQSIPELCETDASDDYDALAGVSDDLSDQEAFLQEQIDNIEGACARATERSLRTW